MYSLSSVLTWVIAWQVHVIGSNAVCTSPGYYLSNGYCLKCREGSYCPGNSIAYTDPPGTYSYMGESGYHTCPGCIQYTRVIAYCYVTTLPDGTTGIWPDKCGACSPYITCTGGTRRKGACLPAGGISVTENDYYCGGSIAGWHTTSVRSAPVQCDMGTYSDTYDASACTACASGTVSIITGATTCTSCSVGTYQDRSSQTACVSCSPGTYVESTGAIACAACGAGYYSQGGSPCTVCPRGTYAPVQGSGACLSCGPGNYGDRTSCTPCPIGTASAPHSHETQTNC